MLKEQSNIYSIISMFCPKIVNNVKKNSIIYLSMYIVIILLIMLKRQYNIFIYVYCNHIVNNVKETV